MPRIVVVLCAFLLLTLAPSVKADPLVITGGSLSIHGIFDGPDYFVFGDNFSIGGSGEPGSFQATSCFPCVPGQVLGLNAFVAGSSLGGGTVTFNGTTFSGVFAGTWLFSGSVVIPVASTAVTLTAPFTFSGDLRVCPFVGGPPDCGGNSVIFSTQLVGQGIATLELNFARLPNGNPIFFFKSLTYNFQPAEVPEPMTITLLAAGLMGLGAKWKFARKRRL